MELYGRVLRCCGGRSRIVLSRPGGFVSQNCESCGKSRKITKAELPTLFCPHCDCRLRVTYDGKKNYVYACGECSYRIRLADYVPHWSELFEECGLGLDSNPDLRGEDW